MQAEILVTLLECVIEHTVSQSASGLIITYIKTLNP